MTTYHIPEWVNVILLADRWGIPPWEVAEGGDRKLWVTRYWYVMREKERARNGK